MKVLSLFDGISCGRVALERAGIPIERYDAYEIDEYAIKVAQKNSPIIQHHGDVTTANFKDYIGYDLLIGGSPCQSLANCNMYLKDGEYGVNGTGASRLFWEYVRALKTINPKYFFFENVASMRNADRDIITEQLGVEPVKINSLLFSHKSETDFTGLTFRLMCRLSVWLIQSLKIFSKIKTERL